MKDLRYYLAELCGITLHCDFRFTGSAAPLPSATMWQWYDLACALINHARAANEDARLTVQLLQAPCLFSCPSMPITTASASIWTNTPRTY